MIGKILEALGFLLVCAVISTFATIIVINLFEFWKATLT